MMDGKGYVKVYRSRSVAVIFAQLWGEGVRSKDVWGETMHSQLSEEELARLKALRDCHVLDRPPAELFDQTARLAAYLCGTPIGLIGFIDATRHWFKSRVGWDYPEIPREHSICGQTILHHRSEE